MKCEILIPDMYSTSKKRLYKVGEIVEIEDQLAERHIALGHARKAKSKPKVEPMADLKRKEE